VRGGANEGLGLRTAGENGGGASAGYRLAAARARADGAGRPGPEPRAAQGHWQDVGAG